MDRVEVVSGVLLRDGRVLFTQRMPPRDFAFSWETPGGKVEPGETPQEAVRRELREELGIEAGEVGEHAMWTGDFDNQVARPDRAHIRLSFYFVGDRFTGTPTPREGQGIGWFRYGDAATKLDLAPGNKAARMFLWSQIDSWMRAKGAGS